MPNLIGRTRCPYGGLHTHHTPKKPQNFTTAQKNSLTKNKKEMHGESEVFRPGSVFLLPLPAAYIYDDDDAKNVTVQVRAQKLEASKPLSNHDYATPRTTRGQSFASL